MSADLEEFLLCCLLSSSVMLCVIHHRTALTISRSETSVASLLFLPVIVPQSTSCEV